MPVPVFAPRLLDESDSECENDLERRFLERLNERAAKRSWYADCWSHLTDHVVISIHLPKKKGGSQEARTDFFGSRLLLGYDETGQFATELDPTNPSVTLIPCGTPESLADAAADWLEEQIATWAT